MKFDPLASDSPSEIQLPEAPLVRVIAQVRFPEVLSIEKREFVAPFQELIRSQYPVLRVEQTQGVVMGPHGAASAPPRLIWRFADVEDNWKVSLAPEFVAIETAAYQSREDFLDRFMTIVQAVADTVEPQTVDRLGVRYIDRITGEHINDISTLVRPEILGIVATDAQKHVQHTLTQSMLSVPNLAAQLLARWGLLPKGGTIDLAAIEPLSEISWILDLDMFRTESKPFVPDEIVADARAYAEQIYTFFRWMVTDDFLRLYGGKI